MKSIKQLLIVLGIAGAVSAATAQTTNIILETSFDNDANAGNFNTDYGYCVAGSSSVPSGIVGVGYSGGLLPVGVGGTYANSILPDYTVLPTDPDWTNASLSYVYAVVGNGTQFGYPIAAITPTAFLGQFILSADVQVLGLLPGLTNADVSITKVQFFSAGNIIFDFSGDAGYVGSNFVHIAVPLSSLAYGGINGPSQGPDATSPVSDFTNAAVVSSIDSFTIEFAVNGLPVGTIGGNPPPTPPFGFTSTGSLTVDNVQLIQNLGIVPTPTVEKLIWQANFDNTFPTGQGGFHYRNGTDNATGTLTTNLTGGVGGSASLEYTMDLSSWSSTPPNSYSGFGVQALQSPLPYMLSLTNKASYRVYLSAKVGGVSAGVTNVPGVMDLIFRVPPGTLTPSNAVETIVFDLNPTMTFTTNWQTYVFDNMPIGVNQSPPGSQAQFNQYVTNVDSIQVQVVPQGSPNAATQFGYDADNTIDIDNIKVVQLIPGLAPISVTKTNSQVKIYWTDPPTGGYAALQSSTNVSGPYVNVVGAVSGAASPYVAPAGPAHQFFRTIFVP
jgi:hypothetical protein